MRQTRKSQYWYFEMKLHFGVDSKTKLIHAPDNRVRYGHSSTIRGANRWLLRSNPSLFARREQTRR